MDTLEKALVGRQNIYSNMAGGIASRLYDVRKEGIKECLSGFQNEAHRLEHVSEVRGILFINDSRATNVNATWFALETMNRPVIWIAGGQDHGNDYTSLLPLIQQKVKILICLGADNTNIRSYFREDPEIIMDAGNMKEAVWAAYQYGIPGDTILLSPACASFDLFDNYADRGNQFKQMVYDL